MFLILLISDEKIKNNNRYVIMFAKCLLCFEQFMEYLSYVTHLPMVEPKTGVRIEPKLNWARSQEATTGDQVLKT